MSKCKTNTKIFFYFLTFLTCIFFGTKVYALDIKATNISLIDKSSTAEVDPPEIHNNEVSSKIILNKQYDYAIFDLTITNNEKNGYKIESIEDNNDSEYIITSYDYDKDYFTGDSKVKVKFLYKKKLINQDNVTLNNLVVTIKLVNDKGESTTVVINNPKTGDNILIYAILLIIALLGFIYLKKKIKIKGLKLGILIVLVPILLLPFVIFALDRYEIPVTFKHVEAKGEFEIHDVMVEGIGLRQVVHGNVIGDLPVQDKDGYSFNGYEDEENVAVSEDTIVIRDMTVRPMYTVIEYNITYDLNGGTATNPSKYTVEDTITLNNPTKQGYTFSGWTGSNGDVLQTEVTISNMTGDLHYVANYSANPDTPYRVIHRYPNLDNTYEEVIENLSGATDTIVRPQTIARTGFNSPEMQDLLIKADGSSELIYNYTRINYNLTLLHPEDIDSTHPTGSYPYQTVINVKAKDKVGYTFDKWSDNETSKDYTFELVRDTTLYAIYNPNPDTVYTVIHKKMNLDGVTYTEVLEDRQILTGETDSEVTPGVNTYEGFTSPTPQTVTIAADGSTVVEYLYVRNQYRLTVEDPQNTEEDKTGDYYYGTEVTVVAKDITGYTFTGWENGANTKIYTFTMIADKTIRPKYIPGDATPYMVKHSKMNIDGETYTEVLEDREELTGVTGADITPNVRTYEGFTSPTPQTVQIAADGSTVVEYLYVRNQYNLIYVDEDNIDLPNSSEAKKYYYGEEITSKVKPKPGYTFIKWNTGDTTETITKVIVDDLVLNPIYEANKYNVIFNNNTGIGLMDNEEMTYDVSKTLSKNIFTKPGYIFAGWNTKADGTGTHYEDEQTVINLVTSGSITLYAEWVYVAEPSITVNDHNTFTVTADGADKYLISTTQTTKPTQNTEGWSNVPTKDTSINDKEIYYVWIQDENGNISDRYATITNYKVTFSAGEGTALTVKADDSITGTDLVSGNYVLNGTQVYPTGSLETGYHSLVIKKGTSSITNGNVQTIEADTVFTTSATSTSAPSITLIDHNTFSYGAESAEAYYISLGSTKPAAGNSASSTFALDTWTTASNTGDLELAAGQVYYVWSESSVTSGTVSANSASIGVNKVTRSEGTGTTLTTKYDSSGGAIFTDTPVYVLNGSKVNVTAELKTGYDILSLKKDDTSINSGETHIIETDTSFITSSIEKSATLTYDANGHGTAPNSVTMKYTEMATAAPAISAENYLFNGWNESADGTGTRYAAGEVVKSANVVPSEMTLYAEWKYNATPTITVNDYNTFVASAVGADKYLISSTQTDTPTSSISGWSTSGSSGDLTLVEGQTYYVWVQDSDGKVSDNCATIEVKTISQSVGAGTTIEVRNENSSGQVISFSNNKANVLSGSTIYVSADVTTGYDSLILKKDAIEINSGTTYTVSANTTFTSSATEKTATLTYDANGHGVAPSSVIMKYTEEITASDTISAEGYIFAGWNTKADGTGTPYDALGVVKAANVVPSNTTLYAQWLYDGQPIVTVNDHNTFTVSAPSAKKYIISKTQTSKPDSTTTGWSTTTNQDSSISTKETYYVWAQDQDGKISGKHATITNYKVTLTPGEGTTLTAKADNVLTGTNIASGSYVLDTTPVYATGALETGYHSLVIKKGTSPITNGSEQIINSDTVFTTSATSTSAPTITLIDHNTFSYNADGAAAYYVSTGSTKPAAGNSASGTFALDSWTTATNTGNLVLGAGHTYYVWSESSVTGGTVSANSASIGVNKVTRDEGTGTTLTTKYDSSTGEAFTDNSVYVLNGSSVYASGTTTTGYNTLVMKKNSTNINSGETHLIEEDITFKTTASEITATLTYDANGHGTAPSSETIKYSEAKTAAPAISATNYKFVAWNTKADGTGTRYAAGEVVKAANVLPSNMTLYAEWDYDAEPTVTAEDHNTFTASAPLASKYLISKTQTTKPDSSTTGWSTTTTQDSSISTKETYYVWVQDADGKISSKYATITNYEITLMPGTGTTLSVKADNATTGTTIVSGNYVLDTTSVYPTGALDTGYNGLVIKKGTSTITNGSEQVISSDTVFITSASNNMLTFNDQTLDSGIYGTSYSSNEFVGATNGTGSYSYSLAGVYPTGTTISGRIISMPANTPAGTYEIEVIATDNNSGATATATMTITINKKALTIKANDQTIIYGNSVTSDPLYCTVTDGALVSNDQITGITLTPSTSDITESGLITPSAAVIKDLSNNPVTSNYEITYDDGLLKIRNASINFNSTGGTPVGGYFYTRKGVSGISNDGLYATTYTSAPPIPTKLGFTLKGWYTAETGGTKIKNSDFSFTGTAVTGYVTSNAWDVTEDKTIYAQWEADSLNFDNQTLNSVTYGTDYTSNSFEGASNGTGSYSYSLRSGYPENTTIDSTNRTISMPANTPAGTYNIIVAATDTVSGAITPATMTIVVNPKPVSVAWDVVTWIYDGNVHSTTATIDTGITGEYMSLDLDGLNSITNVGTSELTASCLVATSSCSNYTLSGTTNTLEVVPRTLTVTAANKSRYYSDANPELTYTYSNQATGETPGFTGTLSTNATTSSNIGSYTISKNTLALANGSGGFLASNYTMSFTGATLTVTRKPIATTGTCTYPVYDGSPKTLASGASHATYSANNTQTNVGASNYVITVTPAANYAFTDGSYSAKTVSCNIQKAALPAPSVSATLNNSSGSSRIIADSTKAQKIRYRIRITTNSGTTTYTDFATYNGTDYTYNISFLLASNYKNRNIYVEAQALNSTNINYNAESAVGTSSVINVVQIIVEDPLNNVPDEEYPTYLTGNAYKFVGTSATITARCRAKCNYFAKWKKKQSLTDNTWYDFSTCPVSSQNISNSCTFTVQNMEYNLGAFCSGCD